MPRKMDPREHSEEFKQAAIRRTTQFVHIVVASVARSLKYRLGVQMLRNFQEE